MPVKGFVDFPHVGGAINNHRTVVLRSDFFGKCWRHRRGEITNYLFQNIFNRHQPLNVSILVDDQADFLFVALKLHQLRAEGRTFRDKIDLVRGAQHGFFGELFFLRHQPPGFTYSQHTDGVVQRITVEHDAPVR